MEITIDQMRDLIKAEKIKPSDLFGVDVLTEDSAVKGYVEAETRKAVAGEYAHRKRTEEGFDKTKKELEDKLKAKEVEVEKFKLETVKGQIGTLFEKQKTDRKLDEKQGKYIQNRLSKFTPTKTDPTEFEKEFNAYLDAEIDEYKKIAKDVFGVEDKSVDDKGGGGEPDDKGDKGNSQPENKYVDPAQNPMIKTE